MFDTILALAALSNRYDLKETICSFVDYNRTYEDEMEEEEEDDINLKAMTVKGHSGHQAHEIEDKVAEYGIDVLQHVRHDGSRLYQLVVLTLTGTKYNYTNIVAKTPIVWKLCSTSNRSELERYNARV